VRVAPEPLGSGSGVRSEGGVRDEGCVLSEDWMWLRRVCETGGDLFLKEGGSLVVETVFSRRGEGE